MAQLSGYPGLFKNIGWYHYHAPAGFYGVGIAFIRHSAVPPVLLGNYDIHGFSERAYSRTALQ